MFPSRSVVGFTAGAGVLIALGQLNQFLGISIQNSAQMSTLDKLYYVLTHLEQANSYSLMLGLLTVFVILVGKKINKNLPGALLGILASIVCVVILSLEQAGVKLTGEIPSSLPPFKMLSLDMFEAILVMLLLWSPAEYLKWSFTLLPSYTYY